MHCYIFEVSNSPVPEDERISNCDLPSWFTCYISDGTYSVDEKERISAIAKFVQMFEGHACYENEVFRFADTVKASYFRDSFAEFQKSLKLISEIDYRAFSGQDGAANFEMLFHQLESAYESRFRTYIYDKDAEELITLDSWIRHLDLTKDICFGGVIDYHW